MGEMKAKTGRYLFSLAAAIAVAFSLALPAQAQTTYKIIESFTGGTPDGSFPSSKLIFDSEGNLYGTSEYGGNTAGGCELYSGCGVVFKLSPTGPDWHDTTLFRFGTSKSGVLPRGALVLTPKGDVIGTTINGGTLQQCQGASVGCGVVYELTAVSGHWSESIPEYMNKWTNGGFPDGLISDSSGNLYGINSTAGDTKCAPIGCGTIFRLSPTASGGWEMTVLYTFTGGSDGEAPFGGLTLDAAGNLYGATEAGGNTATGCQTSAGTGCGVIFKLTPTTSGPWTESILYTFSGGSDGGYPNGDLAFDSSGNLYGTTEGGGTSNTNCLYYGFCGVVFKLSPTTSGPWTESVVYSFSGDADGATPAAGVILDSSGNLYGTTEYGGNTSLCSGYNGCGVVFEMTPTSTGGWQETLLHTFEQTDGAAPLEPLTFDSSGNLYGTASFYGGVVFQISF
jgi:hypothetical protein